MKRSRGIQGKARRGSITGDEKWIVRRCVEQAHFPLTFFRWSHATDKPGRHWSSSPTLSEWTIELIIDAGEREEEDYKVCVCVCVEVVWEHILVRRNKLVKFVQDFGHKFVPADKKRQFIEAFCPIRIIETEPKKNQKLLILIRF